MAGRRVVLHEPGSVEERLVQLRLLRVGQLHHLVPGSGFLAMDACRCLVAPQTGVG